MIFNLGEGVAYKTPVLNSAYPADVTQMEKSGGSATFQVKISSAGHPEVYTYQWYVNDSAVSGATSASYTKTGLTAAGTYKVYCRVTNAAGSVNSRTATLTVQATKPEFSYSGTYKIEQDGSYHWKLNLLTSGKLKFTHLGCFVSGIDVFCVGGGGAGCNAGGGGGYTKTGKKVSVAAGTEYTITIGAGGQPTTSDHNEFQTYSGNDGGNTSAFGVTANGGKAANHKYVSSENESYSYAGDGASGGGVHGNGTTWTSGNGGSDGSAGGTGSNKHPRSYAGAGQGTTTREFGESGGKLYAGGGGGGNYGEGAAASGGSGGGGNGATRYSDKISGGSAGSTNTGGGGGGGYGNGHGFAGGSGVAVIRDAR